MPSAQGPREGIAANAATSQKIFCDAEWHRAFKPPHCRRRWGERGNLKSRTACRRPPYNTRAKKGYTGGKVRFPPVLQVQCFHQVHSIFPPAGEAQCAMPILCAASCRCDITAPPRCCGAGLPRRSKAKAGTDGYGWVRRSGTWHTEGYVLGKFRSTWLRVEHPKVRFPPVLHVQCVLQRT